MVVQKVVVMVDLVQKQTNRCGKGGIKSFRRRVDIYLDMMDKAVN